MPEFSKVKRFGIELEGGWDVAPRDATRFHGDSSVDVPGRWRVGEIVSPILSDWQTGSDFVLVNYPDHTGASCGLHVHMSFSAELASIAGRAENAYHVSLLADSEDYQRGLLGRLRDVGKEIKITSKAFWQRLDGENSYCRPTWSPRNVRESDRYRAVNFAAFSRHNTVEIRVLPMFSKRQISVRMLREVLTFTDRYLTAAVTRDCAPTSDIVRTFPGAMAEPQAETITREVF